MTRLDTTFAALIAAQALHSIEEYLGRLWAVFPPAAFITGLISEDRRFGFIIFNILLLMFGVWCFFCPVRRRWASMAGFVAFWVVIEIINGIGHPLWTLRQGGYTPGVITAPLLFLLALLLIRNYLLHAHRPNQAMQPTAPRSDA
jgi:hypothetical protein